VTFVIFDTVIVINIYIYICNSRDRQVAYLLEKDQTRMRRDIDSVLTVSRPRREDEDHITGKCKLPHFSKLKINLIFMVINNCILKSK